MTFENQKAIGRLQDLVVDVTAVRPKVIAVQVKFGSQSIVIDFQHFDIEREGRRFRINCRKIEASVVQTKHTLFLARHLLDKQIVDMDGRKVVRVNDLRLAFLSTGIYLIAVDVGLEGLLRRLGLKQLARNIFKLFRRSLPSYSILWDDVATISFSNEGIKLSKTRSKLSTLHPSDLADILEDLDRKTQVEVFSALDEENAADVLEEMETDAQINVLQSLAPEKAADVLEKMPADEAAEILDDLHEEKAEELLSEMENEAAQDIRELMGYPEGSVGSLMSPEFISFPENMTAGQALSELRRLKPEPQSTHYLYILDENQHLEAIVALSDLVTADPQTRIGDIMFKNIIKVYDTDPIDTLVPIITKYYLLAVPVVDSSETMVGMVIIEDVIHKVLRQDRTPAARAE